MIPENVLTILDKINKEKEAYVVGGAVRDMLMGKEPHDYDIATNMSVNELKALFPHNYPSGIDYGVITVFVNHEPYEIAHYRTDIEYSDCRHPEIELTESIEKDLMRRDFTINAMAWKNGQILDLFGGKADIESKVIRAVGDPKQRIQEDALRMLRAVRFSAQLGFEIEESLRNAIKKFANLIMKVSAERIEAELTKILTSEHPEKIRDLYELGLTRYFLPEFNDMIMCGQNNKWHYTNVGDHTIDVVKAIEPDKTLRWAALLHDVGKPVSKTVGTDGYDHFHHHQKESVVLGKKILKRFKFSNKEIDEILLLVQEHDSYKVSKSTVRKWIANYGESFVDNLAKLQMADSKGHVETCHEIKINEINKMLDNKKEIIEENSAFSLKDLKVNGYDMMNIGFVGKEIGNVLDYLYETVVNEPVLNEKDKLIEKAIQLKKRS